MIRCASTAAWHRPTDDVPRMRALCGASPPSMQVREGMLVLARQAVRRQREGQAMTPQERIAELIAAHEREMAALVAAKPAVTDGHSDGRRVRYVRAETATATL